MSCTAPNAARAAPRAAGTAQPKHSCTSCVRSHRCACHTAVPWAARAAPPAVGASQVTPRREPPLMRVVRSASLHRERRAARKVTSSGLQGSRVWTSLAPLWSGAAELAASMDQNAGCFQSALLRRGRRFWLFRHPGSIATGPACCSPVRQCAPHRGATCFALCNDRKIRKSNCFSATSLFRRIPSPMTVRR